MFLQAFLLGAHKDIDRWVNSYTRHTKERAKTGRTGVGVGGMFDLLHDASCITEDLCIIVKFMEAGGFIHDNHKLWKQARHLFHHDLVDLDPTDLQLAQTKTRNKYLRMPKDQFASLKFERESFEVGGRRIVFKDAREYLEWADAIYADYLEWSRVNGHLDQ